MIFESSADASMAVSETIRAKIQCFSMVSICIGRNSKGFNILEMEKV